MTSLKLPEGYEICPHCEGDKRVLYEGKFAVVCKLCRGTGMIDWVRMCMQPPLSNREKPMSYLEHKRKVKEFRRKMKERIKNDRRKNESKSRR
jgi:hypothetical protein